MLLLDGARSSRMRRRVWFGHCFPKSRHRRNGWTVLMRSICEVKFASKEVWKMGLERWGNLVEKIQKKYKGESIHHLNISIRLTATKDAACSHLTIDIVACRRKCCVVKVCLSADDHSTLSSEVEIRRSGSDVDLPDELTRWIPNLNTITAASIDVAPGVAVDTFSRISKSVTCFWFEMYMGNEAVPSGAPELTNANSLRFSNVPSSFTSYR